MPSISRKRTRKNRALKRTRKINSRRVRKNSQSAGGIFGSTGTKISGFFKGLKSKTPKVSLKMFGRLKGRFSRKKHTSNNGQASNKPKSNPLANDLSVPPRNNTSSNGNGINKPKSGNGTPSNGNGNVNSGNGNKSKNGANTNKANKAKRNNAVPPANTPVNAGPANNQNTQKPTTNGGNGQNKNKKN